MSNYIVLVKQVPDVSQITDNAFNPETGTLIRSRLENVINELDAQALAFANRMRDISGDNGKIIALTMGPSMATDVLRYSLSRCADSAVFLTDRKLGGADTWATANPLAFAIRKIVAELLDGDDDYYVVSGMQSVDGDTAQVPGQISEELSIPCVAYATDVHSENGKFVFDAIISGGSHKVAATSKPAIITVAKYEYPLFATFAATRKANKIDLVQWGADDINATGVGVSGSKTRVIRVFPPGKTTRKCTKIDDTSQFAKKILESFGNSDNPTGKDQLVNNKYLLPHKRANSFHRGYEGTEKEINDFKILEEILSDLNIQDISKITEQQKQEILDKADGAFHSKALDDMLTGLTINEPQYQGQVWVMAEHNEQMHPATYELIGKARELADSLETKVGVVLVGDKIEHFTESLIHAGADVIYTAQHPLLKHFDPKSYKKVVSEIIEKHWPQIILYAATPRGRILAPMVSYRLNCGLTADCTSLDIKDSSRRQQIAVLMQTRPALGGNVMATICTKDSRCQMATARPGVMKRLPDDPSRTGQVIEHQTDISPSDISLEVLQEESASGDVDLARDVIVSGGKGMQSRDNYDEILSDLTKALSSKLGVEVERGASRAAVEQGFIDRAHQVGQTGTSIGPKIYLALGISGAIQHMIGVANSENIFAVNSDPEAPIFKQCDYYMIGNVEQIVPDLVEQLNK